MLGFRASCFWSWGPTFWDPSAATFAAQKRFERARARASFTPHLGSGVPGPKDPELSCAKGLGKLKQL